MWMLLVIVLLTACSDHSGESSDEKDDCFLNIYVYAPERPMLTRADVGDIVSRSVKEHMVHSLQIWVFKHSDGSLVGYLPPTSPTFLNETDGQEMFRMEVDKEFADHPVNVDVYVVANAGSVGLKKGTADLTLGANTSRSDLDAAKIGTDYFGTTNLYNKEDLLFSDNLNTGRIARYGLPMSGVLKNQSIYGSYPTLRVGTQDAMATLQLTRAVSKLRFVLCQKKEKSSPKKKLVSIDGIQLDGEMIPTESYLMPGTYTYSSDPAAPTDYENNPIVYVNAENKLLKTAIPAVKNPMDYAYETQAAQEYEEMINGAIAGTYQADANDQPLMELGLTYLRESDKKLTGTIKYTVEELEENVWETKKKTATFSMADSGDFLRNHSWIVYVFYMDATIYTLTVTNIGMKSWASGGYEEKSVYNW